MPAMRARVLVALLTAVGTWAQKSGGQAGDFKAWVLALEWQTTWNNNEPHPDVVARTTNTSYAGTHLSLHGLWPQFTVTDDSYPQDCKGGQEGDFSHCKALGGPPNCKVRAEILKAFNTSDDWQKFALEYAYGDLANHEWPKHGGCSGYTQDKYFQTAIQVYQKVAAAPGPAFITKSAGTTVTYKQLSGAFEKKVFLKCRECALDEVWLTMNAEGTDNVPGDVVDTPDLEARKSQSCETCSHVTIPMPGQGPPTPPTPPSTDTCVHGVHGPACTYDRKTAGTDKDACLKLTNCKRCAHSGFCTDESKVTVV